LAAAAAAAAVIEGKLGDIALEASSAGALCVLNELGQVTCAFGWLQLR
jgi:hypothetical protein